MLLNIERGMPSESASVHPQAQSPIVRQTAFRITIIENNRIVRIKANQRLTGIKEIFMELQNVYEGSTDQSEWKESRHAARSNKVVHSC